jgi:hypothetical protein
MSEKKGLFNKERFKKVADNLSKAAPYLQGANKGLLGDEPPKLKDESVLNAEYTLVDEPEKKTQPKKRKEPEIMGENTFDRMVWGDDDAKS